MRNRVLDLQGTPNPGVLVLSGVLLGFFTGSSVSATEMGLGVVPETHRGRWLDITPALPDARRGNCCDLRGANLGSPGAGVCLVVVSGMDLYIRMPLLTTVPETLRLNRHTNPSWIATHTESARCRQPRFSLCSGQ